MTWLRLLRSDWLKTKRTPLRLAIFAAPVGYALLLLWYFSSFRVTPELPLQLYRAFFEGWTVFLPLAAGSITGLLCLLEEQAGRFGAVLGLPTSRILIYANKLLLLIVITAGSVLLSVTILIFGLRYGLRIDTMNASLFYEGALLAISGSLSLLALHLWLSFAFGLGAGVGVGAAGLLTAAIIGATHVGDPFWQVVPWAWPVRLAMHPLDPVVLADRLPPALLLFAVLAVIGSVWFHQWEGRKLEE
jgi:ABC-2 type transport system permease protein